MLSAAASEGCGNIPVGTEQPPGRSAIGARQKFSPRCSSVADLLTCLFAIKVSLPPPRRNSLFGARHVPCGLLSTWAFYPGPWSMGYCKEKRGTGAAPRHGARRSRHSPYTHTSTIYGRHALQLHSSAAGGQGTEQSTLLKSTLLMTTRRRKLSYRSRLCCCGLKLRLS
jgi:hypothetical protein